MYPFTLLDFLKVKGFIQDLTASRQEAARVEPLSLRAVCPAQSWASVLSIKIQIIKGPCSTVLERYVHTSSGEKCLMFWLHKILLCPIGWPMGNK